MVVGVGVDVVVGVGVAVVVAVGIDVVVGEGVAMAVGVGVEVVVGLGVEVAVAAAVGVVVAVGVRVEVGDGAVGVGVVCAEKPKSSVVVIFARAVAAWVAGANPLGAAVMFHVLSASWSPSGTLVRANSPVESVAPRRRTRSR